MGLDQETRQLTMESIHTPDGLNRFCGAAADYVNRKVRENSFAQVALRPHEIQGHELHKPKEGPDSEHDVLYCTRERPATATMSLPHMVYQPEEDPHRYNVPVVVRTTDLIERTELQLAETGYDILSLVDETTFHQVHTERDKQFLAYCDMAVAASGQEVDCDGLPSEDVLRAIRHPHHGDERYGPQTILMSKAMGQAIWPEVPEEGFPTRYADMPYIQTLKTDLFDDWVDQSLQQSCMYVLSPAELLGDNLRFGRFRMWAEWEGPMFKFRGWDIGGLGLKDVRAVTKVVVRF